MDHRLSMALLSLEDAEPPNAVRAVELVRQRPSWDCLTISDSERGTPYLNIMNHPGYGITVHCEGADDLGSFFLSRATILSTPSVEVDLSGLSLELWSLELFLDERRATEAAEHFIATRKRRPDLIWVGSGKIRRTYRSYPPKAK